MSDSPDHSAFGPATACQTLADVQSFIRQRGVSVELRIQAAAWALAMAASNAVHEDAFIADTLHVIDEVSRAKVAVDIAAYHDLRVVRATAAILLAAQTFLDEATIPCTEWPTPREMAQVVHLAAAQQSLSASA